MATATKVFKKGEFIFKEGDKAHSLFLIQTGRVSAQLQRSSKIIELGAYAGSQVLGEGILLGLGQYNYSALATQETTVIEVSGDLFKAQIEAGPQFLKVMLKSLLERYKFQFNEIKTYRLEKDGGPCPPHQIPKTFASIFHTVNHTGKKNEKTISVEHRGFRLYCQKVFLEPFERIDPALQILQKMGLMTVEKIVDPDSDENIGRKKDEMEATQILHFSDLTSVEQFFEFYQYFFYKTGTQEMIKVDDNAILLVSGLCRLVEPSEGDRGVARLDYPRVADALKKFYGFNFNKDHLSLLELKGLFVKRQSTDDDKVLLSFDYNEFRRTLLNWRILREIDKWNKSGRVDPTEDLLVEKKVEDSGGPCPSCKEALQPKAKFCSNCGAKIGAAA